MLNIPVWQHFLLGAIATCGFSIFFNAPRKLLLPSSLVGGLGWIIYIFLYIKFDNPLVYAFTAAVFVSVASEILARVMKQPAIVFIIPGILPLVPGITLYNTVLYTIQKDYTQAATTGTRAIIISIGISLGILVVASLSRMFNIYKLKKAFSSNATNKYVSWVNIGKIRTSNEYLVDKNEMNDSLNSMDLDFGDEDYSGENSKPVVEDQSDIEDNTKNT